MKYFLLTVVLSVLFPLAAFAQTSPINNFDTTKTGFIPLSDIPAFQQLSGELDLSKILNDVYGICIGLAAILTVIVLMYAGVLYMGDSISEKKVAKDKIQKALFGLLLVLSPAIVFGIIDKRILSLSIDTSPLTSTNPSVTSGGLPSGGTWTTTDVTNGTKACQQQGGTVATNGNGMTCTAAPTSCPTFTSGSTPIAADGSQDGCCTPPSGQAGCTLVKGVRGQNSCSCN